jgi:hypothetical protein
LDTCPVRSLLYFAAAQWQRASSIRLAMDLATILTTIWVCPPKYAQVRNLYFKEIGRLKTSVDTLPMSGGQGVAVVDRLRLAEDRVRPEASQWC